MSNPKPLAEEELQDMPEFALECRPYMYRGEWRIEYGDGDISHSSKELRRIADWQDRANGIEPQKSEAPSGDAEKRIAAIFGAWLLDRAEQYSNDSCCRCVFDELMTALDQGEPWNALRHGELDDLLKGFT